jgi:hypothetical protein
MPRWIDGSASLMTLIYGLRAAGYWARRVRYQSA